MHAWSRLPVLVLLLLSICALACRPSWSPDGNKILFPYFDPMTYDVGVALHDRVTNETRSLFARRSERWDDRVVIGQWGREGERAVLFSGETEILTLPVDSDRTARRIEVPQGVLCGAGPWPVIGDRLFCCGDRVFRIDLSSGSVASRRYENADKTVLVGDGNRVLYLRFVDRERDYIGYELGELDPESLKAELLFRIGLRELETLGIQELDGSIALEPGGRRLAMTARTEGGSVVLLVGERGVESVLHPALSIEPANLGNIEWAHDSGRLLAVAASSGSMRGSTLVSLAEIPLTGGPSKLHPIVELRRSYPFFEPFEIQISLSPDGATVALATTYLDTGEVASEDRALYLFDLEHPARSLTKIVWPPRR